MTYRQFENTCESLNQIRDTIHEKGMREIVEECDSHRELRSMLGCQALMVEILEELDDYYNKQIEAKIKQLKL